MRRTLIASMAALLCLAASAAATQNTNSSTTTAPAAATNGNSGAKPKRPPVFRATKDQIKQAQDLLRQRAFYGGDTTGKLDTPTREGLRKYQEAEGLKVTGTLNAVTLQKMNITLTDKQKLIVAQQQKTT